MRFKIEHFVHLDDSKIDELVTSFVDDLTDYICQIEEDQTQKILDLIGGVFPIMEDDEVMEIAFDLVQEIHCKVWYLAMEQFNLVRKK